MIDGNVATTTLYGKDSKGKIRVWKICGQDYDIVIRHGLLGGAQQEKRETVTEGKQKRTRHEQLVSMITSKINKQKDKGYVEDLEVARTQQRTNAAGFVRPMLAHPIDKMSKNDTIDGAFWSKKLDGHRCMITKRDGVFYAYSRNGKSIDLPHLFVGLDMKDGETIDGEVYWHGESLQRISSLIKDPKQAESAGLKFHCYDYVCDAPFRVRLEVMQTIIANAENVVLCEQIEIKDGVDPHDLTTQAIADGYEGGILRLDGVGYLDGKKTNKMLKLKSFDDGEFLVLDIEPSKDGWAVLKLANPDGQTFSCNAPGTIEDRYEVMENKDKYIGRSVQIKHSGWTPDGIPFQPVPTKAGWVDRGELG